MTLALQALFEVALLDRRDSAIDDDEFGFIGRDGGGEPLDLALAEQRARRWRCAA